jgi:hypothetical protein
MPRLNWSKVIKAWDRYALLLAARKATIYRQGKLLALKLCPDL